MACGEAGDDVVACGQTGDDVIACGEAGQGELLTSLWNHLQDEDFADIRLRLRDGEMVASRPLVAALSPVFRRMLAAPMRERNEGEIVLDHVSKDSWDVILRFYFRGEKLVTPGNVDEIADIAYMYDMKGLTQHCSQILSETVTVDTVFSRLELASKYDFKDSRSVCLRLLGKHFAALSCKEEFSKLSQEDLLDLFGHPLLVTAEDNVCRALLSWLEQNQVDEDTAVQLFDQVKLQDASTEYIRENTMYHPQVMSRQALRNKVTEEFRRRYASTPASEKMYERPPTSSCNILLLGHDGKGMRVFGSREPVNEWHELPPNKEVHDQFAACMLDGSVYVTGGEEAIKSTFVFDVQGKNWSQGPSLLKGRRAHSMTSVGQSLFVVGGHDSFSYLSSVEELQSSENSWAQVGNLKVATSSCGLAAVNSTIIVVGGVPSEYKIQTFDIITKTAAVLEATLPKSLNRARGMQCLDDAVFVGENGALVTLKFSAGEALTVEHTQLRGFGRRGVFGLLVDSHIRVFGGSEDIKSGIVVNRFNRDGVKVKWRAAPLPVPLTVSGVFRTSLSCQ